MLASDLSQTPFSARGAWPARRRRYPCRSSPRCVISPRLEKRAHCRRYVWTRAHVRSRRGPRVSGRSAAPQPAGKRAARAGPRGLPDRGGARSGLALAPWRRRWCSAGTRPRGPGWRVRRVWPIASRMPPVAACSWPRSNMTRSNTSCAVLRTANPMLAGVNSRNSSTIAAPIGRARRDRRRPPPPGRPVRRRSRRTRRSE